MVAGARIVAETGGELEFRILGPLAVLRGGSDLPVTGERPRALLAALLLCANRPVPVDTLVAQLWGDTPPRRPRAALQMTVTRLRQALGDRPDGQPVIRTTADGYRIVVDPERLDLIRFDRLLRRSEQVSDPAEVSALLATALDLWNGPALADVRAEVLQRDEVPPLNERWTRAVERRIEAELRLGRHAHVVADLRELTTKYPMRERFWSQFMRALWSAGRRGEALETYQRVTRLLADELGIDPSAELRRLYQSFLADDAAAAQTAGNGRLEPAAAGGWPAASVTAQPADPATVTPSVTAVIGTAAADGLPTGTRTAGTEAADASAAGTSTVDTAADGVPASRAQDQPSDPSADLTEVSDTHQCAAPTWLPACQLPPDLGDFVGREATVSRLATLLDPPRDGSAPPIVVVGGQPGVGKTASALRAAHRLRGTFPDGQWYVPLLGASGAPLDPVDVMADLLQASGMELAAIPAAPAAREAAYRARLADRRVLLVLDDAVDEAQVRPLLPGTPTSAVLVTSRTMQSGLADAVGVRLDPLDEDEAVALFGRVVGPERIAREEQAAREIAALCGHLPLALRITGGRLAPRPRASLTSFALRLGDESRRLDELTAGGRSVRGSLELSYAALERDTRTAFRCLGLLPPGDFAAWTLAALAGGSDGERLVEQLVEASLLDPMGVDSTGEARYRPHDLVLLYARELSERDSPAERQAAYRRYVDALVDLAFAAYLRDPQTRDRLPPDEGETVHVVPTYEARRLTADRSAWLRVERHHLYAAVERACVEGWYADAARLTDLMILLEEHDLPRMVELHELVRDAAARAGDERVAWRAEYGRAMVLITDRLSEAAELFERCGVAFERVDAPVELVYSLTGLVFCRWMQNADVPLELAERALQVAERTDDVHAQYLALRTLGEAHSARSEHDEALVRFAQALPLARQIGDTNNIALNLNQLAGSLLELEEYDRAAEMAYEALAILTADNDTHGAGYVLEKLSRIESARGRHADATAHAERSRRLLHEVGDRRGMATATVQLAAAHIGNGEPGQAIRLIEPVLPILVETEAGRTASRARRLLVVARGLLGGGHRAGVSLL